MPEFKEEVMLKIDRADLDRLGFDFGAALAAFREAKQQHPFTIDVPAPTAHHLVEKAFEAGGFEVLELLPPAPKPEPSRDLEKSAALESLKKLSRKTVGGQLDEIREVLQLLLERLPG